MINWLKKHHIIHTWSKWQHFKDEHWVNDPTYTKPIHVAYWQSRHCEVCHKEQREEV